MLRIVLQYVRHMAEWTEKQTVLSKKDVITEKFVEWANETVGRINKI
jgi:hypothetical protein